MQVNTATRFDIKLAVGTVAQTVQIQSAAPLLETDRSDLGKVIDKQAIEDLPLFANGGLRSNIAFATLSPGVVTNISADPDTTTGAPRISGGTSGSNTSLLLDGAESNSERRNDPQMRVVSADGIEEFKVQTGAYSAEYGRTSNGILNYSTKSGTNEFHGSAFLVIRNQALNANGFFYTFPPPGSSTVHNQNLEALTVGGPVWIPKVFNGKNKAFFFFSGERSRAKDIADNSLISLPTPALRTGNFSGYTGANGQMIPIYDPGDTTNGNLANNGGIIANANARVPFPGNIIPASRINPVSALIQTYIPLPANPNSFFNNNPIVNTGSRDPGENQAVYAIKGDFNPSDKWRMNGLFSRQYFNGCQICMGPMPGPLGEGFQEFFDNKYVHFNADYIVSPTLLNHFTFGYDHRDGGEAGNERLGPNTSGYGLSTEVPGNPSYSKAPNYTWYGFQNYPNTSSFVQTSSPGNTVDFKDGMTWSKGKQTIKFGAEFLRQNYARSDCNGCGGELGFTNAATGNPGVSTSGLDYASFLLGLANSAFFNYNGVINYVYPYYAAYFQDDIKLTKKLTINVGLRYDLPLSRREPNGQSSNFSPTTPNPAAGNIPGALIFAGSGPGRTGLSSLLQHRNTALGPRLGFAYQLNSKTVIRAGGAIMYDSNREDGNADGGVQGFGGNYNVPANNFSTGVALILPNGTNASVAGFTPYAAPIAANKPPVVNPGIVLYGSPSFFSDGKAAQLYDYNFTVERTVTAATLLRVALLRSAASPGLRIVVTVAECYYRIVARRSAGITRLADLRGKKVGTALNTSAHYFLSKMTRTAGLSESDVTAVAVPLPEMPAALKRGDVDAISIWEPQAHNAEQVLGADAVVFQDRSVYRELFNLNTTAEVLADPARRRGLVAAVARIVRASERVTATPSAVWPLVTSKINVNEPTISAVWRHFRFAGSLPADLLDVMTEEERWAAAMQKREPRARQALEQLIDRTVLRDALLVSATQ